MSQSNIHEDDPKDTHSETAILGGGCFWCLEAAFERVAGVTAVTSGYCGGHTAAPTYADVCTGTTGHIEVVRLEWNPEIVSYERLLRIFFILHDPTSRDRQGADVGSQYRSAIFCFGAAQFETARRVMAELDAAELWPAPLVTEVRDAAEFPFHPAESEHHAYYRRHPQTAYCAVVIGPKLAKLRQEFAELLRPA